MAPENAPWDLNLALEHVNVNLTLERQRTFRYAGEWEKKSITVYLVEEIMVSKPHFHISTTASHHGHLQRNFRLVFWRLSFQALLYVVAQVVLEERM